MSATKTKPQPKKVEPRKLDEAIWAHIIWDHDIPVPEEPSNEPFDPSEW